MRSSMTSYSPGSRILVMSSETDSAVAPAFLPFTSSMNAGGNDHSRPTRRPIFLSMCACSLVGQRNLTLAGRGAESPVSRPGPAGRRLPLTGGGEQSRARKVQLKRAALAECAVRNEVTTHSAREIPADREAKTGSLGRSRTAGIYLNERLEDLVDHIRRDPETGVGHAQEYE